MALLVLLAACAWLVLGEGPLPNHGRAFDSSVTESALRLADDNPGLTPLAEFLADLGSPLVAGPVLALAVLLTAHATQRRSDRKGNALPRVTDTPSGMASALLPVVTVAIASVVVVSSVAVLKAALGRRPPPEFPFAEADSGFFPSGHAATALLCWGGAVVVPVACRLLTRRCVVVVLVSAAGSVNVAVGAALVWCGYHWALDVLGAWLLTGAVLCVIAAVLLRRAPSPDD
ncbi:phosphatase PAP2 family protein [Allostreptomyces psammosilenae]|uniref:Undecaprenyl-diphosphatase n=1 Tax=Allostreptomyces psammosilenae TaxID=1892865 RepID=A0A853A4N2_9ACTN|nr:phosphatase PAP2 family protein [Allostreptomyces psammosilenae]NYI08430.1 undecaprenyl-diphosphatase [Allostreptomyces psammosilenae]